MIAISQIEGMILMEIKIWELPPGWYYSMDKEKIILTLTPKGYLEMDTFDADECWELCNWRCWMPLGSNKPKELCSDLATVSNNVVFHNPEKDEYYIAMPGPEGWHICKSLDEVMAYCEEVKNSDISVFKREA